MDNYEIEILTDEMMKHEFDDLVEMCAPGWCGPVDGFILEPIDTAD